MDRLYIVRHGIAVPHGTPGVAEDERPLTSKGRKRFKNVARGLRALGVAPDRIATSPLPRARQTAEIAAEVLGLEDALEDADALRNGASAESIRSWLDGRAEARLMIVGHNPSLTELVALLLGGRSLGLELKKGGVAAFRAAPQGGWHLDWLATPGLLRRL